MKINLVQSVKAHKSTIWNISWSPDGKLLASCSGDKSIKIWRLTELNQLENVDIIEDKHEKTIRSLAWSPNGKYLACASFDSKTSIWRMGSKKMEFVTKLEGHESEVKSVSWSKVGNTLLATCSRDKSVWIWSPTETDEFECVSVLNGHSQDVKMVQWHPTKELLISSSYDDSIKIWAEEMDDWDCVETLREHKSTVWAFCLNSQGTNLCSVGDDKKMILWKLINSKNDEKPFEWKKVDEFNGHDRCIYTCDWSPKNNLIATGSEDNYIRIFNVKNDKFEEVLKHQAHDLDINCVAWNPSHPNLIATTGDDKLIKIWYLE